jgi:hypothetical protein
VKSLLQLVAYAGNDSLVRYLQEQHVKDKDGEEQYNNPSRHLAYGHLGSAFLAAVRNQQIGTAYLLKDGNKSTMAGMCDIYFTSRCLLEVHEETIRRMIALVMKSLEHSNEDVREAALSCLSSLGAQGMYSLVHLEPFAHLRLPPS